MKEEKEEKKDKKVEQDVKENKEKKPKKENKEETPKKDKKDKKEHKEKKHKEKKDKKKKDKKDKKPNKLVEIIKKKWLIDGTKTIILVIAIIAVFVAIAVGMQQLDLEPLDFTEEKLHTLTDESKEKVKDIDKEIKIYFIGYSDDDENVELVKQYHDANEKITVETIDATQRPDIAGKYISEQDRSQGVTQKIGIECGDKSKTIEPDDLYTFDTTTYETISIAEQRMTIAILSIISDYIPKIYFLEGFSPISLDYGMKKLGETLEEDIYEVKRFNMLSTGRVPEDCDTLVILAPNSDFDDMTTTAIRDYINAGGNILWLNACLTETQDLPNVNQILRLYGIQPFQKGIIYESDSSKMAVNYPDMILPELESSKITKDLMTGMAVFPNATKINIDGNEREEKNVEEQDLVLASETSYFRRDFSNQSLEPTNDDDKGSFIIGCEMDKTIEKGDEETGEGKIESKLIIFGGMDFASDAQVFNNIDTMFDYNKDLVLNSIAYLTDKDEDVTVRKSTGTVTFAATQEQHTIVMIIIFAVPIVIIMAGIIVWQVRRRKK